MVDHVNAGFLGAHSQQTVTYLLCPGIDEEGTLREGFMEDSTQQVWGSQGRPSIQRGIIVCAAFSFCTLFLRVLGSVLSLLLLGPEIQRGELWLRLPCGWIRVNIRQSRGVSNATA